LRQTGEQGHKTGTKGQLRQQPLQEQAKEWRFNVPVQSEEEPPRVIPHKHKKI